MTNLLLNLKKWVKSMLNVNIRRLKYPDQTVVMLHSADPKLTLNHVEYWLNPLINSDVKFSILVRDTNSFKKIKSKYPHIQLLYANTPVDVETTVNAQPNLKIVLYPSNMAKNIHLLRFIELTHVFIGTKHSDRLSKINKSYRAYDEIWISGQAQIDKFKEAIGDTRHLEFKIIGKPQLLDIFLDTKSKINDACLYLSDDDDFILELGQYILNTKDLKHIFYSKNKFLDNLSKATEMEGVSLISLKAYNDIFLFVKNLKYIVVDIKSIDRYLLAFDVPIFVYLPKEIIIDSLELDIPKECLYFFSDNESLQIMLEKLSDNDALQEQRTYASQYFLGKNETLEGNFYKEIQYIERSTYEIMDK